MSAEVKSQSLLKPPVDLKREISSCRNQVLLTFLESQAGFEVDLDGLLNGLAVRPRDVDQDTVHVKDEKIDVEGETYFR